MNSVTFPEFKLIFNISQIAVTIGNFEIYYYAIFIVCGIIISLILASKSKENFGISFENLLEIMIISLIFGVIGARLYYVIFKLDYYIKNFDSILNIRDGGLAIYGGIIFGGFTACMVCKKKRIDIMNFFDYIAPYLVLSQAIGRIGNFFNIEAYGIETSSLFRMGIYSKGTYMEVHPCFLYEFTACILIFIILRVMQKKRVFKGQILSLYLILYGISRFFIEGIRADSLMFLKFKVSQIISIIFVIIGFGLYLKNKKKLECN